jgi:hypothetical protein
MIHNVRPQTPYPIKSRIIVLPEWVEDLRKEIDMLKLSIRTPNLKLNYEIDSKPQIIAPPPISEIVNLNPQAVEIRPQTVQPQIMKPQAPTQKRKFASRLPQTMPEGHARKSIHEPTIASNTKVLNSEGSVVTLTELVSLKK